MKTRFDGQKNFDHIGSQIKVKPYLAFFLFWVESARHFINTACQFVPVPMSCRSGLNLTSGHGFLGNRFAPVPVRIKGGGRNA